MFDEAVDDSLSALKFILDWFVKDKIRNLHEALFAADDDTLFSDEDFVDIKFCGGEMGILSIDLDKINLVDVNFYEDDRRTVIHVRLLPWCNNFEKRKAYKKDMNKELKPAA